MYISFFVSLDSQMDFLMSPSLTDDFKDQMDTSVFNNKPMLTFSTDLIGFRKEMFYLMTHSTHFIYGYMASNIWLRTILIVRKETRCRHIGYSFRLTARVLLYHHPTDRIAHTTAFVRPVVEHWLEREIVQWVHPMKDRSDDPSHHERTF